jgi:hypothetical protein
LVYLDYFNTIAAMVVGTIAALAFGVYMFRELEGWDWFRYKELKTNNEEGKAKVVK